MTVSAVQAEEAIREAARRVTRLVVDKNHKYNCSIFNPANVYSKEDWETQLNVRIDDKLSRLKNRHEAEDEDPYLDILGYELLRMAGRILVEKGILTPSKFMVEHSIQGSSLPEVVGDKNEKR